MISLSTAQPVRHVPTWLSGDDAPAYLIRSGSVIDRAMLEAELTGEHQAGRVFAYELDEAFIDGVNRLLADDPGREELLELFAQSRDITAPDLDDEQQGKLTAIRDGLAVHWPPYRELVARMARRREVAPLLAFRRFVIGWENLPVAFEKGPDGRVTDAALKRIDPLQLLQTGNVAYGLLYPDTEDLEGNSERPSPSDDSPTTSVLAGTSKAAGKSAKRSGSKTRA